MSLVESKNQCSGCGACKNVCPKSAIKMVEDENGFWYPSIDYENCISCGLCEKVCDWKKINNVVNNTTCYYAARNNVDRIKLSTSGGIFAVVAEHIIDEGGLVCGSYFVYDKQNKKYTLEQKLVQTKEELKDILGSKYSQSYTGHIFKEIKRELDAGKLVLYCSTPCQIAGLKNYLSRTYDKLLLVDLICHGVPSMKIFNDFLKDYSKNDSKKDIVFRDKTYGRNSMELFFFSNGHKSRFAKSIPYYYFFLEGDIYRESCYSCKYASQNRVGDITLGDAWGIEVEHPECLNENGGKLDKNMGISCVLLNTEKGKIFFEKLEKDIDYYPVTFDELVKYNHQLKTPTPMGKSREQIFENYKQEGYKALKKIYWRNLRKRDLVMFNLYIPIKAKVKTFLNKMK